MKHQYSTSSVSRSPIFSDFPPVACFRCRMLFQACGKQRQGFRAEYAPQEEDSARNGSAARPCRCHQTMRYLCIRASGTSGWRNESQLYHRLLPLPQETNNVISVSFLVAQILFVIVKTCSDSLFTIGSKNCQLFVAKLGNFLHSHNRMAFY